MNSCVWLLSNISNYFHLNSLQRKYQKEIDYLMFVQKYHVLDSVCSAAFDALPSCSALLHILRKGEHRKEILTYFFLCITDLVYVIPLTTLKCPHLYFFKNNYYELLLFHQQLHVQNIHNLQHIWGYTCGGKLNRRSNY